MPKQELDADELFNLALSIVGIVLRDGSMQVTELATHFDVSEKAIEKAVKVIANSEDIANFETHFEVQDWLLEEGEVSFSPGRGNLTRPPVLSQRQAVALGTGLEYLSSLPGFEKNTDLETLRRKLIHSVTPVQVESNFSKNTELEFLRDAIRSGVSISCEYRNQKGETSIRQIDPLRIDFLGKRHYLRGWCRQNLEVRSFRLDRMINLTATADAISPEALKAEISENIYGEANQQIEVQVIAKPEAAEIFWNFPTSQRPEFVSGEYHGTIRIGDLASLGRHITRYGGQVRVIAPQEAKQAVFDFAQSALSGIQKPENED